MLRCKFFIQNGSNSTISLVNKESLRGGLSVVMDFAVKNRIAKSVMAITAFSPIPG
jgi:hypothetical protein